MNYELYKTARFEVLSDGETDLSALSDDDLYTAMMSVALERDRRRGTAKLDQQVYMALLEEMEGRHPARKQLGEALRGAFVPGKPDGECPHCGAPLFKWDPEDCRLRRAGVIRDVKEER